MNTVKSEKTASERQLKQEIDRLKEENQVEITELKTQLDQKEKLEKDRREGNLSYFSEIKEYGKDIYNWIPNGGKLILFIILIIPILWILKYVFRLLNWLKKVIIDIWTEIRNIFPKSTKGKKAEIKKPAEDLEDEEEPIYKGKKRGRKKKIGKK